MTVGLAARAARPIVCLLAALAALWIGWHAAAPPVPLPADAPPTAFSAARAMRDVRAIAMRPHPAGSREDDRVAATLLARMAGLGMRAELRHYLADEATARTLVEWSGGTIVPTEITDVVGVSAGRDPAKPALLLMAHHDTVWGSPGAPDDSAGVAAGLEIVRAIRARGRPERDVVLLFTDAEETGLAGAKAFWAGGGLARHVGVVVNLESRGGGGRATMFETGARAGEMMRLFARAVDRPLANSMAALAYRRMPNNTDFSVPRDLGVPGFNFAYLGRARYYHSPLATIDRLDPATLQDLGQQALGIASALAFAPTLPASAPDLVYFDLPGGYLAHYPAGRGWFVILGALALLGVATRRLAPSGRDMLAGAGASIWIGAAGVLTLIALNAMSGAGGQPNYYDRLAALPRLEWQAALGLLGVSIAGFGLRQGRWRLFATLPMPALLVVALVAGAPHRLAWIAALAGIVGGALIPRRVRSVRGEWLGLLLVVTLAGVLLQWRVPLVAWLVGWPALLLAAVAAAGTPLLLAGLGAAIVAAALLPVAHLTFLGLGAPHPELLVPFALIGCAAFWPLARMRRAPAVVILVPAGLLLVAAIAIARDVRSDPLAVTVPAYSIRP